MSYDLSSDLAMQLDDALQMDVPASQPTAVVSTPKFTSPNEI